MSISFISHFLSYTIGTKGTNKWTKEDAYSSSIRIQIAVYDFRQHFYSLTLHAEPFTSVCKIPYGQTMCSHTSVHCLEVHVGTSVIP